MVLIFVNIKKKVIRYFVGICNLSFSCGRIEFVFGNNEYFLTLALVIISHFYFIFKILVKLYSQS